MAVDKRLFAFLLAALIAVTPMPAQDGTADAELPATDTVTETEKTGPDYYYELNEAGVPVFKQVLSWKPQKGALEYEVILESVAADGTGTELLREKTVEPPYTVSLTPGTYRWRIIIYNMLGKAEVETGWTELIVIKAEFPVVESLFPFALYMEEGIYRFTIRGDNILPGAEFHMVDEGSGILIFKAIELERYKNETIELEIPKNQLGHGNYRVKVVNPGGLFDTTDMTLKVRYKKPVDIVLTAGYSPVIPLADDWFASNWNKGFYPVGFSARADVFFLKRRFGFFGIGAEGRFAMLAGGTDEATLNSMYIGMGLNFVYKYLITPQIHFVFRAGGGAAWNAHGFDYTGSPGPEMASWDLYATGGLAVQILLKKRWIIEPGVEVFNVFHSSYNALMICPHITAGIQF